MKTPTQPPSRTLPGRLWLTLIVLLFAPLAPALTAELVSAAPSPAAFPVANIGFEGTYQPVTECANISGAVALSWSDNTCRDQAKPVIAYAPDSINPHSGGTSQRVTLTGGSQVHLVQYFTDPFAAATRYTKSVWLRAKAPMFVTIYLGQPNRHI